MPICWLTAWDEDEHRTTSGIVITIRAIFPPFNYIIPSTKNANQRRPDWNENQRKKEKKEILLLMNCRIFEGFAPVEQRERVNHSGWSKNIHSNSDLSPFSPLIHTLYWTLSGDKFLGSSSCLSSFVRSEADWIKRRLEGSRRVKSRRDNHSSTYVHRLCTKWRRRSRHRWSRQMDALKHSTVRPFREMLKNIINGQT